MEKITLYKKINYYNKDNFINSDITEKKTFDRLDEALESMKNTNITYIENKKGVSAYEELYVIHQTDPSNYVKYNKTINTVTKNIEDNIPESEEKLIND